MGDGAVNFISENIDCGNYGVTPIRTSACGEPSGHAPAGKLSASTEDRPVLRNVHRDGE